MARQLIHLVEGQLQQYSSTALETRVAIAAALEIGCGEWAQALNLVLENIHNDRGRHALSGILHTRGGLGLKQSDLPDRTCELPTRVQREDRPSKKEWEAMLWEKLPETVYVDGVSLRANHSADSCRRWLVELDEYIHGPVVAICAAAAEELPDEKVVSFAMAVVSHLKSASFNKQEMRKMRKKLPTAAEFVGPRLPTASGSRKVKRVRRRRLTNGQAFLWFLTCCAIGLLVAFLLMKVGYSKDGAELTGQAVSLATFILVAIYYDL